MRAILSLLLCCAITNQCYAQTVQMYASYKMQDSSYIVRLTTMSSDARCNLQQMSASLVNSSNLATYKPTTTAMLGEAKLSEYKIPSSVRVISIVPDCTDTNFRPVLNFSFDNPTQRKQLHFLQLYKNGFTPNELAYDYFFGARHDSLRASFETTEAAAGDAVRIVVSPRLQQKLNYVDTIIYLRQGATQHQVQCPINCLPSGYYLLNTSLIRSGIVVEQQVQEIQKVKSKLFVELTPTTTQRDTTAKLIAPKDSWLAKYSPIQLHRNATAMTPMFNKIQASAVDDLLASNNDSLLRNFLFNFWSEQNPSNPEQAWLEYAKQLNYVARNFGFAGQNGYETDRGRVHLRYGAPVRVEKVPNERDALPYEVWIYPNIDNYNDIYFIFFQSGRLAGDFKLLHSNLPGELYNQSWRATLFRDPTDESHRVYEWINQGGR
ncbi:MAG: hypothetical protein RL660_768 [Bacteroidota bacterium]